MYFVKNAFRSVVRSKGRSILIGILITTMMMSSCVALSIYKSGNQLVHQYRQTNSLAVSFVLNPMMWKEKGEAATSIERLNEELVNKIGDSTLVKDYYYYQELNVYSSQLEAVDYEELWGAGKLEDEKDNSMRRSQMDYGDFRLTGYSDTSYVEDFIDGVKKIVVGQMVEQEEMEIVISEELAEQNDITVGDEIRLAVYSDGEEFSFTVVGIFEDNSDMESNGFMQIKAMNSRNQIYTNMKTIQKLDASASDTMERNQGITAKFYLNQSEDLTAFEEEAYTLGLSDYYTTTTNEDEILEQLRPIQNISNFSLTFLIVILSIGAIVLVVIHMIHIRDRKYEIGVLRAIGMTKMKVMLQLVAETFMISLVALAIGTGLGVILSQPISNTMLQSEIDRYQEKLTTQQQNFGPGGIERPDGAKQSGMNRFQQNTAEYIRDLKIQVDFMTMIQLFIISLLLTLLSAGIAVFFVNQCEPNKILQNRN